MKPNLCETCILQAICTKSCNGHNFERVDLSYQVYKMRRYIISQNGTPRKHIRRQQLKHFTALTKKWIKNISQSSDIHDRRFLKDGKIVLYGSYKSKPTSYSLKNKLNK